MSPSSQQVTTYSGRFYDEQRGGSQRSASVVVPMVLALIQPDSVVDVGCGVGTWLSIFKEHGVPEILGIDGEYVDRAGLEILPSEFRAADLTQPLTLSRTYDLAVSLEVAEHIPEAHARTFVASLVDLAPIILFSAAVPGQGGTAHVNEQWPDYWVALFNELDLVCVDILRSRLWMLDDVAVEYAQNAMFFCRPEYAKRLCPQSNERAMDLAAMPLVHPRLWQARLAGPDPHGLSVRANVRVIAHSALAAWRSGAAIPAVARTTLRPPRRVPPGAQH